MTLKRSEMDLSGISRVLRSIAVDCETTGLLSARERGAQMAITDRSGDAGKGRRQSVVRYRTALSAKARALRELRMQAAKAFPEGLISDPVFDMLLDLFIASEEGDQSSISDLLKGEVAATTKLRWLARLEADGLVERQPDPHDRRRFFITLSEDSRGKVQMLLEQSVLQVAELD